MQKFQKGIFDGTSSILVSTVVWPEAMTCSESAVDMHADTSGVSIPMVRDTLQQGHVKERSSCISHATGSQPEVDAASVAASDDLETKSGLPIDVPFHAHVLTGRGIRRYCLIPIVLIADFENIVPLMTSSLYQRSVWGISEPVVGLAFSKSGVIVQVFLGWLEFHNGSPVSSHWRHSQVHSS